MTVLITLGVLFLFILGCGLGAWATWGYLRAAAPAREQALRHELTGLRAAQRLSLAAWQTRLQLSELIDEQLRQDREAESP